MQQKTIVGVSVVIALAFGAMFFFSTRETVIEKVTNTVSEPVAGSASSPSVIGGCMDINGVQHCTARVGMTNASTTCSMKLPPATSTLAVFTAHFSNPRGDLKAELGVGTKQSGDLAATTTRVAIWSVLDATAVTVVATSGAQIVPNELTDLILPPNQYLNVRVASSSDTMVMQGTCSMEVITI